MAARRPSLAAVATVLGPLLCGLGPGAAAAPRPASHTVVMEAVSFQPADLTVRTGDAVVWVNRDFFPHTATATASATFDSGIIAPEASWTYTAKTPGVFPYVCILHPTMKATLRVQ